MGCEKYESGIIMKVEVKVTKRDMQRFPESLGNKDNRFRYGYGIYTADTADPNNTFSNRGKAKIRCHSQVILPEGGKKITKTGGRGAYWTDFKITTFISCNFCYLSYILET